MLSVLAKHLARGTEERRSFASRTLCATDLNPCATRSSRSCLPCRQTRSNHGTRTLAGIVPSDQRSGHALAALSPAHLSYRAHRTRLLLGSRPRSFNQLGLQGRELVDDVSSK